MSEEPARERQLQQGGREEPRGDRRNCSHRPAPLSPLTPLTLLTPLTHSLFLSCAPSVRPTPSPSLSLDNLSLPAVIPTTFSRVTQQKEEASGLTVAGAAIPASSRCFLVLFPPASSSSRACLHVQERKLKSLSKAL